MRTYLAVCIFMCGFTSADSLIGRCLGPTSAALKDQRVKTKIEWAVWIATGFHHNAYGHSNISILALNLRFFFLIYKVIHFFASFKLLDGQGFEIFDHQMLECVG
ncbi:uncharacterized protein [Physcomitrium patens]|uniref:uncharacterized protein isoform X1 n=1 Tax=Physcomitrium patens TaxID=3218 RepID=UPI000D15F3CE|nr:uncharacterized protein LOC112291372 [Physcomitrium patens]|eukprot:XP_024394433.1 uncharacterized protein LOC112291372 [Physcomitrella patens]